MIHPRRIGPETIFLPGPIKKVVPPLRPAPPPPPGRRSGQPKEDDSEIKVIVLDLIDPDANNKVKQAPLNDSDLMYRKRSVDNINYVKNDLDSIILKLTDDTGHFNIKIKIGSSNASTKEKDNTRVIESTDISKYTMSLKTKNNDIYKISEVPNNTVIHVDPKMSVSVDEYNGHVQSKRTVNNDAIQVGIVDLINNTIGKKSAGISLNQDSRPTTFFSNETKLTNNAYTNAKELVKRDLPQQSNNASKTNPINNLKTVNNTAYNLTMLIKNTT